MLLLRLGLLLGAFHLAAAQPAGSGREAGVKTPPVIYAADDTRAAMLKLMDRVIADPSDEAARKELRIAALRAVQKEARTSEAERAALMAGAGEDRRKMLAMRAAKKRRLDAWKRGFDRACELASGAETVKEAVAAYEGLLETFPVYSDTSEYMLSSGIKIKKIFFGVIKKTYPYLLAGRDTIDERTLAALQFSRVAALQEFGGHPDTTAAEKELKKAERFRRLERELLQKHENIKTAMDLYEIKNYTEALKYFDKALDYDRDNEEAQFYRALARKKAGLKDDER